MSAAGLSRISFEGMVYDPLGDRWSLSSDTDVNYFAAAARPEAI
jgi:2-polyprenyl-3-methyl-5-hydroxy-6-metoxy-1,4-benzoquinol methylase